LKAIQPQSLLDAGCGSGVPLATFLKAGFNAYGFDRSPEMVEETKARLQANGLDASRVFAGDLDDFDPPTSEPFAAIAGLGSVYYTVDTQKTINNLVSHLAPRGNLVFSLRNKLFSLGSLNEYSADFMLQEFFQTQQLSSSAKSELQTIISERFPKANIEKLFANVDERQIRSNLHNPLTVESELLTPNGLKLEQIYYYHFHALPPVFEHTHQQEFYKLSKEREIPTDWRGMFTASCFVVHASKI
jgi:SAM-dependent methyltransferase